MDNMAGESGWLVIRKEQAEAYGKKLSEAEFLVRAGSTAMREGTPKVKRNRPERDRLVQQGILIPDVNAALFRFSQDHVFSSKSTAAGVVIDGNSNGDHWKEAGGSSSLAALVAQVTRREIELAMDECDRKGLSAFLAERDFGKPRVWALRNNHRYPAKATVAVAIQYLPDSPRFSAKTFFNGFGEKEAFARLEELAYELDRDGETLSRTSIEAAMDAYDSYRTTGAHGEIFSAFDEPRDYWVRSSRERENRVYPTKPINFFVNRDKAKGGGWSNRNSGAAALHNAGFIIVDQDDQPQEVPTKFKHLLNGADRARLVALNYFIEPARERGDEQVSVRIGDISANLFPSHHYRNVWQALRGKKFLEMAKVPPPKQEGVDESSATKLIYQLNYQPEADALNDTNNTPSPSAVNLILYGPPGTGKTYQTAWEAVRLCVGAEAAAELKDDRDALTAEYRRLANEGRIEFLTFHQSLSYEEFVEGFRLKCHEGIFKRISERARLDQGESGGTQRLDRSARVFKVALGRRHVEDERIRFGLDNDLIHLGWGEDIDWSDERFDEFNEIFAEWRSKKNPDASGHDGNIVCTFSFRADMQVGDYVVVSDGRDRIQAFGQVSGEYYFDPDATYHPHRRKMEWLWRSDEGTDRSRFYPNGFRRHSVYKLNQSLIDWDALEEITFGEDTSLRGKVGRDYVLIIDEINRANISKVFGELITLLEQDKRLGAQNEVRVQLPYSKKRFGVPPNLHIVGTMNTADRSIALLDTALRRRFTFQELMPDPTVLSEDVGGINLRALLSTINERIEYLFDREHQIGHAYFTSCHSRADVEDVMRHKVIPLLAEYFYEDWAKVAAVLGDGPGMAKEHFLESAGLKPPKGMPEDDINGDKFRWNVKADFDFSEFEA
jgi:5-methylcytosine-specific restriction protein B